MRFFSDLDHEKILIPFHFIYYTFINIRRKNTSLFKQMLSFKKVGKSIRIRNQPIYLTNFYKYSYLKIFIHLFNLFLDDFLDVSKN